ncbi:DUF4132 domain-containing protein [Actinomadura chokoriensis]|uniref:DUF4132 domain-containing protein n=1 Tax=Actinomadura chokoriensis TaxID=454156 RepID=A0ABV4R5I3_9ACTN
MEDHLADEDALTIPETWRRMLHPRRGGAPGPRIRVDAAAPEAVRALVEETGGAVEALLEGGAGDPALTEAARRHLNGEDDPAGAGAVAAVTVMGVGGPYRRDEVHRTFTDAWIAERGAAFAACALVELLRTEAARKGGGSWRGIRVGAVHREDGAVLGGALSENLRRVRGLLAGAADGDYADAVDRLAAYRSTTAMRWIVSYLVPSQEDWVDECCAAPGELGPWGGRRLVLLTLGKASQIAATPGFYWGDPSRALLATMVDGIGPDVLPFLLHELAAANLESADRKHIFEAIAVLPTDEAFQALIDRLDQKHVPGALGEAARRFPVRALRLLARAGADELLGRHAEAHAELVAAVLPTLPDEVAAAVRAAASSTRVPPAEPGAVPAVLADPPWLRPRRRVVAGLRAPEPRTVWREGERQAWLAADPGIAKPDSTDWETLVEGYRTGNHKTGQVQLMVHGPEELIRPLLPGFDGFARRDSYRWTRLLVARYELDALPVAILMAKPSPETCAEPLMPFLDAGVAALMADWLGKRGKHQAPARDWFRRHGPDAAALLVPAALGAKPGRQAETALRYLVDAHGLGPVVDAARLAHGDEAASAVGELLSSPPVETGLDRPAKIGEWADPAALPQVLLRGGERAVPYDAARRLVELLSLPTPYGMDELRRACDPDSVAEFGWALFQQWLEAGRPSKDGWALAQLGRTGDDEIVRRLTPVIRAWPGDGGHKNAVNGLGVLAEIGSDVALMHLHGIAQKVRFNGLQAEAQARIREVAKRLGLTTEQLADRLVPAFGLDADGSMTLDYGPRRFTVRFDEQLRPSVADEDGRRRNVLPKPGAKDDPELAPAAYKAFAGLKKDVRTVASDQLRRLELAMVTGRRWTPAEFGEFLVRHPLVRHIARRLVWVAEDGERTTAFRIAEDGTFADADDDAFALAEAARVGIAHPLRLGDTIATWSEVFADYEITQPFAQLTRPVHTLTGGERGSGRLERFEGLKVPFGKVLGLVRRGWERGEPQDAGGERWISRRAAAGRYVVIDLDPGISVGAVDATGDHQTLKYVWLATAPGDYWPRKGTPLTFGELDGVTASEILADLEALAEAAVR